MNEFELIHKYLALYAGKRSDVLLGIGDDCALLEVPAAQQLAVSIDNLIENVHFFAAAPPYYIGYKSLAVSLSDMAAVGAAPAWVTAALTLTDAIVQDEGWLSEFCRGFFAQFARYNLQLVGGNMARGRELNFAVQLHGFVPQQQALRRTGACVGDIIYVTGNLGDAGLALQLVGQQLASGVLPTKISACMWERLYCPPARVEVGQALLGVAHAAVDISDGLLADLGHILEQSCGVGAILRADKLPLSSWLRAHLGADVAAAQRLALGAGDDYELCFTAPVSATVRLASLAHEYNCIFTPIGLITDTIGLQVKCTDDSDFECMQHGYLHSW